MNQKVYHLASCSTCQRILKEVDPEERMERQNIKEDKIQEAQLEEMAKGAGSYEALFSRRAMKYKSMNLKDQNLQEEDYKRLILEEYTFLKRPVFVLDGEVFVGNSKKTVECVMEHLSARV